MVLFQLLLFKNNALSLVKIVSPWKNREVCPSNRVSPGVMNLADPYLRASFNDRSWCGIAWLPCTSWSKWDSQKME